MNNDIVIKVTKRVTLVSLLIIGVSFFLFKEAIPIIYGYIFGTIISVLGFKLLSNTINKAVSMTPSKATTYSIVHYMLRYLIYFIVLAIAALADYLNFPAAILGLLSVKFMIIASAIFDKNFQR